MSDYSDLKSKVDAAGGVQAYLKKQDQRKETRETTIKKRIAEGRRAADTRTDAERQRDKLLAEIDDHLAMGRPEDNYVIKALQRQVRELEPVIAEENRLKAISEDPKILAQLDYHHRTLPMLDEDLQEQLEDAKVVLLNSGHILGYEQDMGGILGEQHRRNDQAEASAKEATLDLEKQAAEARVKLVQAQQRKESLPDERE